MWAMEWNESMKNEWNEANSTKEQERPLNCPSGTQTHSN